MGGIRARWVRVDGQALPRGAFERGGILYLFDLKREDGGQYSCQGVDQAGTVYFSAITDLIVTGRHTIANPRDTDSQ